MNRTHAPLVLFPLFKLLLHVTTHAGYGVFRDELYYLACADHLAWGYVDHPPLSIALLSMFTQLFGDSLFAIRLLPAVAGSATVWVVGLMARQLGGSAAAQSFAMLAGLVAPIWLAHNHFFSMNAFDSLFWALAALLLTRILQTPSRRLWAWLGVILGLGLLNKISVLWLGFGITAGLLATDQRRLLLTLGPWLTLGIATVIATPYIVWQVQNNWPTIEFIQNASGTKMVDVRPLEFLKGQILGMNPGTGVVWFAGLVWLLRSREYRALGVVYVAVFALLATNGTSRAGYLAPAYAWLFAAGGVAAERLTARWRPTALRAGLGFSLALTGIVGAPFALPLLPVEAYVDYAAAMGIAPSTEERKELADLPQFYADMHGWESIAQTVAKVYRSLPLEDQEKAAVFAPNYGDAGAVDHFGSQLGLPRAISGHNNYWLWGSRGHTGEIILVIDDSRPTGFRTVELGAEIDCGYCMPYENTQSVWIARGLEEPLSSRWSAVKHFD